MRRRQNSSLSSSSRGLPHHTRRTSKLAQEPIEPKSAHVSDQFLQSFLSPSFNPAEYLNASLPPLQAHVSSISPSQEGAVPLSELSSQAQGLLSQLSVQTTRLTNTLTQLTDDILRSGSRLAYEVELLRGETLSLSESLTDGLQNDIAKFVPGGLQEQTEIKPNGTIGGTSRKASTSIRPEADPLGDDEDEVGDPAYITQLRTLTCVRERLDSVIKTFGDAMEFVFPPSELSVSSGFLSVSAPDAGGQDHSTEEKGQQVLKQLRDEISGLLANKDPVVGVEKALLRVEMLKELSTVWKGTAEEKGRTKFIDGLAKLVEDRHRELLRELEQNGKRDVRAEVESSPRKSSDGPAETRGATGYGFMSQLQKLRSGL